MERKWCTNSKMHCGGWGLGTRLQTADNCVSKEPKYRSLDGEPLSAGCVNTVVAAEY